MTVLRHPLSAVSWTESQESLPQWPFCSYGIAGKQQSVPADLHYLKQVHGSDVISASQAPTRESDCEPPHGDGIVTTSPEQILGVRTADCVPILLLSPQKVAVLHGGWRGLVAGIIERALTEQPGFYEDAKAELYAVVGPCISSPAFEVGPEVVAAVEKLPLAPEVINLSLTKGTDDRWHVDLGVLSATLLLEAGLQPENITVLRSCTVSHPTDWYSYRRDGTTGRGIWTWAKLLR